MAEPVLLLEGVHKSYGTRVVTEVLKGVDLRLERGEFVALVGPSGSGKSTLLNILGLLDRPTAGRLAIAGEETTALENVMMPRIAAEGRTSRAMRPHAAELLARVGLGEKVDAYPNALSGGQQQRVAIARALVLGPPLVLADEPTGNLDTKSADQIFAMLREFNRELGVAFLIVTHDPRLAARCDRTIDLVDGRIVSDTRQTATAADGSGS